MKLRTLGSVRRRRERYSDVMSAAVLSPERSESRMERMEEGGGPGATAVLAGAEEREETAVKRRRGAGDMRRWERSMRWAWRGGGMAAAGGEVLRRTPVRVGVWGLDGVGKGKRVCGFGDWVRGRCSVSESARAANLPIRRDKQVEKKRFG
jgi:hypothetical protein